MRMGMRILQTMCRAHAKAMRAPTQVMLLVVSAPASPLRRSDLACPKQLRFVATAKEKGAAEEAKVRWHAGWACHARPVPRVPIDMGLAHPAFGCALL
jgi:hypothetical protein